MGELLRDGPLAVGALLVLTELPRDGPSAIGALLVLAARRFRLCLARRRARPVRAASSLSCDLQARGYLFGDLVDPGLNVAAGRLRAMGLFDRCFNAASEP